MDELDVEGVLAFAEPVVLNARRLWGEYDYKRRRQLQKVPFPSGLHFGDEGFATPVTCLFFKELEAETGAQPQMVSESGCSRSALAYFRFRFQNSSIVA